MHFSFCFRKFWNPLHLKTEIVSHNYILCYIIILSFHNYINWNYVCRIKSCWYITWFFIGDNHYSSKILLCIIWYWSSEEKGRIKKISQKACPRTLKSTFQTMIFIFAIFQAFFEHEIYRSFFSVFWVFVANFHCNYLF